MYVGRVGGAVDFSAVEKQVFLYCRACPFVPNLCSDCPCDCVSAARGRCTAPYCTVWLMVTDSICDLPDCGVSARHPNVGVELLKSSNTGLGSRSRNFVVWLVFMGLIGSRSLTAHSNANGGCDNQQ